MPDIKTVISPILTDGKSIITTISGIGYGSNIGTGITIVPFALTTEFAYLQLTTDLNNNEAVYISLTAGNLGNPLTDTTVWKLVSGSGGSNLSFADTPNSGDLLGVDFTVTNDVVTATVLNNSAPTPAASVVANSVPTRIQEGFTEDQTVVTTITVGPAGDFSFTEIISAHPNVGTSTISGNSVTTTIPASYNSPGNVLISINVTYTNDDDGTVHSDGLAVRIQIVGDFGTLLSTTKPTAITDFPVLNDWLGESKNTFIGNNTGRTLYYLLPTRTNGYTFKTGILFVDPTDATVIGDHTLYTIADFDDSQDGATFIYTVTEA